MLLVVYCLTHCSVFYSSRDPVGVAIHRGAVTVSPGKVTTQPPAATTCGSSFNHINRMSETVRLGCVRMLQLLVVHPYRHRLLVNSALLRHPIIPQRVVVRVVILDQMVFCRVIISHPLQKLIANHYIPMPVGVLHLPDYQVGVQSVRSRLTVSVTL